MTNSKISTLFFVLLTLPLKIFGQFYDSSTKRYYYRFVSQDQNAEIVKYFSNYTGKADSVKICGLVINRNNKALSNVKCELVGKFASDTVRVFTDEYGKFETVLFSDSISIRLTHQNYSQFFIYGIDLIHFNSVEYEFVLPKNQGTIITKFRSKHPMSKKRITKIQKKIDQEAIKKTNN